MFVDNFQPGKLMLTDFYLLLCFLIITFQLGDPIVHQLLPLFELPRCDRLPRQVHHVLVHLFTQVRGGRVVRRWCAHPHIRWVRHRLAEMLSGGLVLGKLRL